MYFIPLAARVIPPQISRGKAKATLANCWFRGTTIPSALRQWIVLGTKKRFRGKPSPFPRRFLQTAAAPGFASPTASCLTAGAAAYRATSENIFKKSHYCVIYTRQEDAFQCNHSIRWQHNFLIDYGQICPILKRNRRHRLHLQNIRIALPFSSNDENLRRGNR